MAKFTNTYNIGDGVIPDATNTATTGDAVVVNAPTSASDSITARTSAQLDQGSWAGAGGQGIEVVGIAGETVSHRWNKTANAQAVFGIAFYSDTTRRPTTAAHCIARIRSASANCYKLVINTSGVVSLQNSTGTGVKNFQSNTALATGWYFFDTQATIVGAGAVSTLAGQIYSFSTGALISDGSFSSTTVDLGSANIQAVEWGKPEGGAGIDIDLDMPYFDVGTATGQGMPTNANQAPITNAFFADYSSAAAGQLVTITAQASDPDGTVASSSWTIAMIAPDHTSAPSYSPTITAPTIVTPDSANADIKQIVCRAAMQDHSYKVQYTPTDNLGLAGTTQTLYIDVAKASEIKYNGSGVYTPLVWYQAIDI